MEMKYDYGFARESGKNGEWERVIHTDRPMYENGETGPDNCWKLEKSGWCSYVEFKPKERE